MSTSTGLMKSDAMLNPTVNSTRMKMIPPPVRMTNRIEYWAMSPMCEFMWGGDPLVLQSGDDRSYRCPLRDWTYGLTKSSLNVVFRSTKVRIG